MTIQYRSSSTLAYVTTSGETISKPSGTIDGDVMIMSVADNGTSHSRLIPSGDWLEIPFADLTGAESIHLWWRKANSEPSSYTLTSPSSVLGYVSIVTLYSDAGADIDVEDVASQQNSSSATRTFPSVTFTSSSGLLLCAGTFDLNTASTPGGSLVERVDGGQTGIRGYVATEAIAAAGATGTRTASGTAVVSRCVSLALVEGTPVHRYPRYRTREIIFPTSNSGDFSATIPATAEEGDLLVWHLSMTNSGRTFTTPDGWTLLHDIVVNGGTLVYVKTCEAGDPGATVHLLFTGGSTTIASSLTAIQSPRGKVLEVDVSDETDNSASALSTAPFPTITTTQPYTLILCLTGMQDATSFSVSNSNDHLWRQYSVGGTGCRVEMYLMLQTAAGSTGSLSVPWSSGTHESTTVTLAIYERTTGILFDGLDLRDYLTSWKLEGAVRAADVTVLNALAKAQLPTIPDWLFTATGLWDVTLDDTLGAAVASNQQADRELFVEIDEAVVYESATTFVARYKAPIATIDGALTWEATIGISGAPTRSVL